MLFKEKTIYCIIITYKESKKRMFQTKKKNAASATQNLVLNTTCLGRWLNGEEEDCVD